jgi:hypothetical protein
MLKLSDVKEHDVVALVAGLAEAGLEANAIGTVVHIYADGQACEVEFVIQECSKVVTLLMHQVRRP